MKKNDLIFYTVLAVAALVLYSTGKHTEVIGFAQRGLLATGLFQPDVEEIDQGELVQGDLILADASGERISLQALEGKVVFLNLWATWCPPCIAELPGIAELYADYGDKVEFILLSRDREFQSAIDFMERKELQLPIYQQRSPLPPSLQSPQIPSTYVIDQTGHIRMQHSGMADFNRERFRMFLDELLNESTE